MKKSSYIKLITLALSCILLIGVIGVSSSADEVEASAEFVNVTLNYGSENKIVYALSISGAEAADVQLELYNNPSLEGEPQIASFSGSYYGSYPVYYSYGISAKDLADYVYARPVLLSGEVIGETVRYSVAQYCYAVLSNPENDETLISLAEDLLAYGASAQARLIKIGNIADEPLVTEYGYAYAGVSGVSFGGYGSTLVAPDERVVPTYSGSDKVVSWNVTVGGETLNYSLEEAATGIPVSDIAKFVPVFVVSEGFNDDPNVYLDSTNEVYYKNSGVATPVVTTDPANAANKVLQIGGNGSTTKEEVYANLSETVEGANSFTFSTKIYFAKPVNSSKELIRFNFLGITGPSQITLNTVYNDNALKAFVKYNTTFATYADSSKVVLDYGAWYDFQIELIITDNSTGAAKIKISVAKSGEDLVSIFEQDVTITSGTKAPTQVRIQRTSGTANTAVYFDDVILYGKNS